MTSPGYRRLCACRMVWLNSARQTLAAFGFRHGATVCEQVDQ